MPSDLPFDPATITKDDVTGIGVGLSSIVIHIKNTNVVVKTFPPLDKDQDSERRIYEHLQSNGHGHPNILRFFGRAPPKYDLLRGGLVFEYHPRGTLSSLFDRQSSLDAFEQERQKFVISSISSLIRILT